jgi:hypothetical protein
MNKNILIGIVVAMIIWGIVGLAFWCLTGVPWLFPMMCIFGVIRGVFLGRQLESIPEQKNNE